MDSNDLARLESLGPAGVRREIAKGEGNMGRAGSPIREDIDAWLASKDAESSAKRDALSEEMLSIAKTQASAASAAALAAEAQASAAKEQASAAREQALWAKCAAIIAATAAAISVKEQIVAIVISWAP